jgi:hypothetical protein
MNRSIALTVGAIAVTVALSHAALAQGTPWRREPHRRRP